MTRLLALLLLLVAAPAVAEVRAVFVGIDRYAYSRSAGQTRAGFDDLSGAVGDALRMKAALARTYGLAVDAAGPGQCMVGAASETLIDSCATKAAILAAWDRWIAASAPGDTLILYFAGHGSRFIDDQALDQASRFNSTLMAHDARQPGGRVVTDILDYEVRERIDRATSNGVRVVTLFDSCNSGTASRDGMSATRSAPDLRVQGLRPVVAPKDRGSYGAYRVHMAAAGDGEDAKEVGAVGKRAGVFTTALVAAMAASPGASFADIAARVRSEVSAATQGRQVPHAEGALRATLGGDEVKVPLFEVVRDGDRLLLAGGGLVGVTAGSRFALYAGVSDGLAGDAPLAMARVAAVEAGLAVLVAEGAPAALPGRLVAREVAHDFGGLVLGVAVSDPAAAAVVARLGFAAPNGRGPFSLAAEGAGMVLRGRGGVELARLPAATAGDFVPRLATALGKVARVEAWLAAVSTGAGPVSLCVQNIDPARFDPRVCPKVPSGGRVLGVGKPVMMAVTNAAAPPSRHVYVLGVDPGYGVTVLHPALGAVDPAIGSGQIMRTPEGQETLPDAPGDYRFVALASDVPLNAGALEQTAAGVMDPDACTSAAARAFCVGTDGRRTAGLPRVRGWAAAVVAARVVP